MSEPVPRFREPGHQFREHYNGKHDNHREAGCSVCDWRADHLEKTNRPPREEEHKDS